MYLVMGYLAYNLSFFVFFVRAGTMAPVHISVGLKETPRTIKGFPTTKRELRAKPSRSKGKLSEKKKFARDVIREVCTNSLLCMCWGTQVCTPVLTARGFV